MLKQFLNYYLLKPTFPNGKPSLKEEPFQKILPLFKNTKRELLQPLLMNLYLDIQDTKSKLLNMMMIVLGYVSVFSLLHKKINQKNNLTFLSIKDLYQPVLMILILTILTNNLSIKQEEFLTDLKVSQFLQKSN